MANKFAQFTNKFDEIKNKLQKQKEDQENSKNRVSFDNSWKFNPVLPKTSTKMVFKVRILPNIHDPEATYPWVLYPAHMLKKPDGKFFYALCPSVNDNKAEKIYNKCPLCEKASVLFKTKNPLDEKAAKEFYKKKRYFVNVLVLEDPRVGDQNQKGKVLIWEYGVKIQEKFETAITDLRIDFINPLSGQDFLLVLKKQGEFTNYDSSNFVNEKTPAADTEQGLNELFDSILSIKEKVYGDGPSTYEKILERYNSTSSQTTDSRKEEVVDKTETIEDVIEKKEEKKAEKAEKTAPVKESKKEEKSDKDDDFDFNFDD